MAAENDLHHIEIDLRGLDQTNGVRNLSSLLCRPAASHAWAQNDEGY